MTCYYFYLWDDEFGPGFIKICAYFPYPAKIWMNGHEWAKRQALHAGIGFAELSNGSTATNQPAGLQAICDRLGPDQITEFADRWFSVDSGAPDRHRRGRRVLVGTVDASDPNPRIGGAARRVRWR